MQTLAALQDYAKDWAEEGIITVVFVCTRVPATLHKRNAWSHAFEPLTVGDVTPDEARQFLRQRGVEDANVEPILEVGLLLTPASMSVAFVNALFIPTVSVAVGAIYPQHPTDRCPLYVAQVVGGRLQTLDKCATMLQNHASLAGAH